MAELFSKEYLKDLLQSDSLADAAATTAKAGFESATKKAEEKSGGLFSAEYLQKILDSDSLVDTVTQHIDDIIEERPDVADAILADPSVRQYDPPDQSTLRYISPPTQKTSYEPAPSPPPAPQPASSDAAPPGKAKAGKGKILTAKNIAIAVGVLLVLYYIVIPSCTRLVAQVVG